METQEQTRRVGHVVKRKVKDLQPGDVVTSDRSRHVVLFTCMGSQPGTYRVFMREVGIDPMYASPQVPLRDLSGDLSLLVEGLTPAQERADELLSLVRDACADVGRVTPSWLAAGCKLIEQIDPPVPPTLGEALESLEALTPNPNGDPEVDIAVRILARARATGLLK